MNKLILAAALTLTSITYGAEVEFEERFVVDAPKTYSEEELRKFLVGLGGEWSIVDFEGNKFPYFCLVKHSEICTIMPKELYMQIVKHILLTMKGV